MCRPTPGPLTRQIAVSSTSVVSSDRGRHARRANLQIQARNRDARLAESNAETIRVLLDQADINGAWIQDTRSSPTSLSSPEEKRANMHRFSVDFSVAIERT